MSAAPPAAPRRPGRHPPPRHCTPCRSLLPAPHPCPLSLRTRFLSECKAPMWVTPRPDRPLNSVLGANPTFRALSHLSSKHDPAPTPTQPPRPCPLSPAPSSPRCPTLGLLHASARASSPTQGHACPRATPWPHADPAPQRPHCRPSQLPHLSHPQPLPPPHLLRPLQSTILSTPLRSHTRSPRALSSPVNPDTLPQPFMTTQTHPGARLSPPCGLSLPLHFTS